MERGPVFVVGATGQVGGEIVRQLVRAGVGVRAGVRDPDRAALPEGVEAVRLDLTDPATYGALEGARRMFLLWAPGTDVRRHVLPLIDEAARRGVRQVVFLSILGAERVRIVPHRTVERHLEASGLGWVFLRASYFMQNFTGVHRDDVRLRDEIYVPAGRGRTSFVDVRDVAAVAVRAFAEGFERRAYDLTGDAALTYGEVADILSVTLGRRVRYADPAPLTFVRVTRSRGTPLAFALFMLAEYTVARLGLAGRVTGTVREVLGRPATSWRVFAEDHRQVWLRGDG
ncbi:NAD(P)H-binding protein [Deinococcus pimensis]|uniref:NAD(P)H-binding protein n=1 Tax=Deinococcus pimensis TaxID=309888 RepID=UPI001B7F8412|nr:NAD(P)H-binding protein [Deinococcus pimensis]